ncbi:MAG: hypothetical protein LBQ62_02130 [Candidatus Accumulibacter sp.]|jgi:intein/homing endonuclease|nr:hypothetical protein [Accumulibacter sp.]
MATSLKIDEKITRVNERISYPSTADGCFPKGTRIHTKEGMKSIEDIQVGDWVLSSPEDGSGKPEYKRVLKTIRHEKKTLRKIAFGWNPQRMGLSTMAATGNHPFWVEGIGWTRADKLKNGDLLRMLDGTTKVEFQVPIYQFREEPGIGWVQTVEDLDSMMNPATGFLFDYENFKLLPENEREGELDWEDMTESNYLKVTVYNLEVEDYHTYYIGRGTWVHNADCSEVGSAA